MKSILLALIMLAFSHSAFAGWSCSDTYKSDTPRECASAGSQETPEAFISLYAKAVAQYNTNSNRTGYAPGTCESFGSTTYSCEYTWQSFGSTMSDSVGLVKKANVNCPQTVESKGADSPVIKTSGKYYVAWQASSVTSDICHDSCSYLASSTSTSTCYLSHGSTSTGFCNYVVGLNSASPSCGAETGYVSPGVGDPLDAGTDPGDGGNPGTDPDDGGSGGGNNGGTGGSGFDGELTFDAPGALDADSVIASEENAAHYKSFVNGMQSDLNGSGFGQAITEFQQKISAASSGGVCPTADIPLFDTIIRFDAHCSLFASLSSVLTAVFMAAWSLLALRVFLSA